MSVHGSMPPERIVALRKRLAADGARIKADEIAADVFAALDALEAERQELAKLRGAGHTCGVLGPCAGGCLGG